MAQEVVTNEQGQKIVVQSDGTWQYFEGDSATLCAYHPPAKQLVAHEAYLDELQKKENDLILTVIQHRLELVGLWAKAAENQATLQHQEALALSEERIRVIETELSGIRSQQYNYQQIGQLPPEIYRRWIKPLERVLPKRLFVAPFFNSSTSLSSAYSANVFANGILLLPPVNAQPLSAIKPATSTKMEGWETTVSRLFEQTDRTIEADFLKANLIETKGFLRAWKGGLKVLNLEFYISSMEAAKVYGPLPQGEYVELEFINGKKLRLFNTLPENGGWAANIGAFVSYGQYSIGHRDEKMLRSHELQRVLVRWGGVKETFEIYEVDFFLRQFRQLDALMGGGTKLTNGQKQ